MLLSIAFIHKGGSIFRDAAAFYCSFLCHLCFCKQPLSQTPASKESKTHSPLWSVEQSFGLLWGPFLPFWSEWICIHVRACVHTISPQEKSLSLSRQLINRLWGSLRWVENLFSTHWIVAVSIKHTSLVLKREWYYNEESAGRQRAFVQNN